MFAVGAVDLERLVVACCEEPGLFATAFALPQPHTYGAPDRDPGLDRSPLGGLRAVIRIPGAKPPEGRQSPPRPEDPRFAVSARPYASA